MRKYIYSGILFFTCLQVSATMHNYAKKDTVNEWQITYNGKEILGIVINGLKTYLVDSIADNGVITVDYYTDSPCEKCAAELQFRNEDGKEIATIQKLGVGGGAPFKLPGMQFRQIMKNHEILLFYRNQIDGWSQWVFVGRVKSMK